MHSKDTYIRALKVLGTLTLLAVLTAMLAPLMVSDGLPSFRKGVFKDATIAYYIETAKLIMTDGWWTDKWCAGFQDLVRFYPPIGIALMVAALKVTDNVDYAVPLSFGLAIAILVLGVVRWGFSVAGVEGAIFALLSLIGVSAWVTTIAFYWEYTRILGDGMAFLAVSYAYRALSEGNERYAVLSGCLVGLAILTSLVSAVWLAVVLAALTLAAIRQALRARLGIAALYPIRIAVLILVASIAVAGWWIIPALLPWGLSHYVGWHSEFVQRLRALKYMLALKPPFWVPSIQFPILVVSIATLTMRRGSPYMLYVVIAVWVAVILFDQGLRLVPVAATMLLVYVADSLRQSQGRIRVLARAVVVMLLVIYSIINYTTYFNKIVLDHTYVESDEYKIALWLSSHNIDGCSVYAMYGEELHANQWINVFAPNVRQVTSGFMEGCINPLVWKYDWIIKNSLDINLFINLTKYIKVKYLIIDKKWLENNKNNIVKYLVENDIIKPIDQINRFLHYSIVYSVSDDLVRCGNRHVAHNINAAFVTPARILGLILSIVAAFRLARARVKNSLD